MQEILLNVHIHSTLSDGTGSYAEIAKTAADCGIDVIIITDHNVYPRGLERYYNFGNKSILVLTGEEVHDPLDQDQKNHLLIFNPAKDYAHLASDHQALLDSIHNDDGLSFIAHPVESDLPSFGEPDISWVDWSIHGFTGLELWNGMSEIKHRSPNGLTAVFYALFPDHLAHSPHPKTIEIWDSLLNKGLKPVGICGADAHQLNKNIGFIKKKIYPYSYHFRALNNHVILPKPLSGRLQSDKKLIFSALQKGSCFIGYDLIHPSNGFSFSGQGNSGSCGMGEEIPCSQGITIQISTPAPGKILLFRNGKVIQRWKGADRCAYTTTTPGVYRVEVWRSYLGKRRTWILSNPIYLVD